MASEVKDAILNGDGDGKSISSAALPSNPNKNACVKNDIRDHTGNQNTAAKPEISPVVPFSRAVKINEEGFLFHENYTITSNKIKILILRVSEHVFFSVISDNKTVSLKFQISFLLF